jgi:transposase-like protein
MKLSLHKNARTTPAVRNEIKAATGSERDLAQRFGVSRPTIRKWRAREGNQDASHCPHRLKTTLTEAQEAIVVELRQTLLLPLDDLLVLTREFLNPAASRSGLNRCLVRHGVSNLAALIAAQQPQEEAQTPPKAFKAYEPGFVHIDIKYLPQMPDEAARRYLYVAIDRATRWVHLEVLDDKEAATASGFLLRVVEKAPFILRKCLTDNGKEFTDRYCATGERQPTGRHAFDLACAAQSIEHRLSPPRHPQTNGMVERFNGRIAEVLNTHRFDDRDDLEHTLLHYLRVYNNHIPQRALGHLTPLQAIQEWRAKRPELFNNTVNNQAGLDTSPIPPGGSSTCWRRGARRESWSG